MDAGAVKRTGGTGTGSATGSGWGPIDEDLVGTASARLLASGVARRDRLDALSLLGLLVDHADAEGKVRLSIETLAGEFGVPPARGDELLSALTAVEVVDRTGKTVVVGSTPPGHAGGFRLAGFLANVVTVLDDRSSDRRARPRKNGVGAAVLPDPVKTQGGRERGRGDASPVLPRVLAGVATAFVVMWATASPSGEPSEVRTVAGASSSTGRAPWATTPSTAIIDDAPGVADDRPASLPADAAAPTLPAAEDGKAPSISDIAPSPDQTSDNRSPMSPELEASASDVLSRPPQARRSQRPGPASRPDPPSGPGAPSEDGAGDCPIGVPEATVVDTRLLPATTRGLLQVVAEPGIEVRGTLRNPSAADIVVRDFEVRSGEGDAALTIAGTPTPMAVPAGGVAGWRVILPPGAELPVLSLVDPSPVKVEVLNWSWSDPVLSSRCPS